MLEGYSVPFNIDAGISDLDAGVLGVVGLLSYSENTLNLDYQPFDKQLRKLDQNTLSIALREIAEIVFKKGLFGGRIVLRPMRMSALAGVPGKHDTELVLKVKRRHFAQAAALISRVRMELSEVRLGEE